jgi:hypothetical protein
LPEFKDKLISMIVGPKEVALVGLIREKRYSRIEIQMKDGEVARIYADEEIPPIGAKVDDIIRSNAFQTITLTEHDGDLVRIKRTIPIKL